jgi:TRAP-type mannitol/chloroaromatic compound transport system permease small subunit
VKKVVSILLNLCLGLFLACGAVSLVDDSLRLLFGLHLLTVMSGILSFFAFLVAMLVYGLMGLTPIIPKRVFLPVTLFYVAGFLVVFPALIYCNDRVHRILQLDWAISFCQVIFGLGILYWLRGGLKFRWPIVEDKHLGNRRFSWLNLSVFLLVNIFVLLPAIVVYLVLCAALAVNHFSEGFMALRPGGLTVEVRKYVRNDGKTVELIPMEHVAEADFYRKVSQLFPTNSIILMEGVTDRNHLITNEPSYKRMAHFLHLAEQQEGFEPTRGKMVMADVDTAQFSTNTIDFLNLVMLIHSKGVDADTVMKLVQYSPPPDFQEQLMGDLLRKRNRHLLEEIQARLPQSDNIIVPWGVVHMPGIANEIQKSGFRLGEIQEYTVIQFRSVGYKK